MLKKLFKFIHSLLIWYFIGSLFGLVLSLLATKIFHTSLSSSVSISLYLITVFLIAPIVEKISRKIFLKTNIGKNSRIKKFYNPFTYLFKAIFIPVIILLLLFQFALKSIPTTDISMLPTLRENSSTLYLTLPLRLINPSRQDIIINSKKPNVFGISRIIGIPGDRIVLKDGYIFLNGKLLDEPYILKPRSTWAYFDAVMGQNCQEIVVPKNNYFVAGDNRKASGFGFIPRDQIMGYVPNKLIRFLTYNPIDWSNHLRDTSHDKDLMGKSVLNVNNYIELVNKKRAENGISPLKYDKKLEESAGLRLQNIVKYDDLSYEATRSGYTMWEALSDVGYSNGLGFELIAWGSTEHDFLLDLYWPTVKELLSKDLQYIGIATKVDIVNNCPRQTTVQHFQTQSLQGYSSTSVTPTPTVNTYTGFLSGQNNPADIKSLQDYIDEIQETRNSWQSEYSTGRHSQQDLDKLLDELTRIISFSKTIINNLQSGKGNATNNLSLWQAVVNMNDEVVVLTKKLNGQ